MKLNISLKKKDNNTKAGGDLKRIKIIKLKVLKKPIDKNNKL